MDWEDFSNLQCKLIVHSFLQTQVSQCKYQCSSADWQWSLCSCRPGLFSSQSCVYNWMFADSYYQLYFMFENLCCWQDADKKGLSSISEEVKNLAQKAKENSLKPQDYEVGIAVKYLFFSLDTNLIHLFLISQGGTFTVSNLGGPFGIKQFCAIINPPQSAILAVGSGKFASH